MLTAEGCESIVTLTDAQINKVYRILRIAEGKARRRLLDMGFTPGAEIYVSHRAPFGDTVLVGVRGFTVALREDAAGLIELETVKREAGDGI